MIDKFAKSNILRILVGNKTDLVEKRNASPEERKELPVSNELKYNEISP